MQMSLAHDHGAGPSHSCGHGRVGACNAILLRVEAGTAGGVIARDVEAILDGDRNAEERRPLLGKASAESLSFR